jgi:hypothetical protein
VTRPSGERSAAGPDADNASMHSNMIVENKGCGSKRLQVFASGACSLLT